MGKLHYLTALLLIILLAIASGWVFESIEQSPKQSKEKLRHTPDYFLKNFTSTTMNKSGKIAYKVQAVLLEHYPDTDSMDLQQTFFTFYEKNNKAWTVKANKALILQKNKQIHLSGNVILKQIASQKIKEPMRLTAEQLTIDTKKNIIRTKSKVKLIKGHSTINATGMRANMNKKRIEFLSNTRSQYVLPAK